MPYRPIKVSSSSKHLHEGKPCWRDYKTEGIYLFSPVRYSKKAWSQVGRLNHLQSHFPRFPWNHIIQDQKGPRGRMLILCAKRIIYPNVTLKFNVVLIYNGLLPCPASNNLQRKPLFLHYRSMIKTRSVIFEGRWPDVCLCASAAVNR